MVNLCRRTFIATCAVASASWVAGCAAGESPIAVEGAQAFPSTSLTDLVTYGDVAVTLRIEAEHETELSEEERRRGEGSTTRLVRAVADPTAIWTRPSLTKGVPNPDEQFEVADGGHMVNGSRRRPLLITGRPPLEVGARYVAIRTWVDLGQGPEWVCVAFLALDGDRVRTTGVDGLDASLDRLDGLSLVQLAATLTATPPDPAAVPYLHLDPVQRYDRSLG